MLACTSCVAGGKAADGQLLRGCSAPPARAVRCEDSRLPACGGWRCAGSSVSHMPCPLSYDDSFGRVNFEETRRGLEQQVAVPAWCSVDCKLGSLSVKLDFPQVRGAVLAARFSSTACRQAHRLLGVAWQTARGACASPCAPASDAGGFGCRCSRASSTPRTLGFRKAATTKRPRSTSACAYAARSSGPLPRFALLLLSLALPPALLYRLPCAPCPAPCSRRAPRPGRGTSWSAGVMRRDAALAYGHAAALLAWQTLVSCLSRHGSPLPPVLYMPAVALGPAGCLPLTLPGRAVRTAFPGSGEQNAKMVRAGWGGGETARMTTSSWTKSSTTCCRVARASTSGVRPCAKGTCRLRWC